MHRVGLKFGVFFALHMVPYWLQFEDISWIIAISSLDCIPLVRHFQTNTTVYIIIHLKKQRGPMPFKTKITHGHMGFLL